MATPKIFESEYRFCQVLWANEPIKSTELAKRCNEKLGRSKTTTYTVIKRLCDRGAIQNENTIVTSMVSQDEVQAAEIDELVEKKFDGSLPAFVATFTQYQKLSEEEIDAVQAMDRPLQEGAGPAELQRQPQMDRRLSPCFGEVGVKERMKNVLNYEKPAF